jgi:hypothetical protein
VNWRLKNKLKPKRIQNTLNECIENRTTYINVYSKMKHKIPPKMPNSSEIIMKLIKYSY